MSAPPPPPTANPFAERPGTLLAAVLTADDSATRFGEVQDTRELRRILALPKRDPGSGEELAAQITQAWRTPWGTMALRAVQGLAIAEIARYGGAFLPLLPGEGKTAISYAAPVFARAKRYVLVVPAALVKKTRRDFRELARHFQGPHPDRITIISYQKLSSARSSAKLDAQGRVIRPGLLEALRPDLLFFDECHKLKNRKAAVTRKITKFLKDHPGCKVIAASGTITKRSLRDYSHLARWCLREHSPVPITDNDLEMWSGAIDEKVPGYQRVKPGAFRLFDPTIDRDSTDEENLIRVRKAYGDRLVQTPGVVSSRGGRLDVGLTLLPWHAEHDDAIEQAFEDLRTKWTLPDGQDFADPMTLWRHARSLALGMYYRWNPAPPDEWRAARKAWNAVCREILKTNKRNLYSELDVVNAVALGLYPEAREPLDEWRKIRGAYDPEKNKEAVWISDSGIHAAERWVKEHGPGIIWCEHVEFGRQLARKIGLTYYGAKGESADGGYIEGHSPKESVVASIEPNIEGRNLQKQWHRNLVMSAPPNGYRWEQMTARTHRPGQEADEVEFWVYESCWEAVAGLHQARRDCRYTADTTRQDQRLCYCDWGVSDLEEIESKGGWRWLKGA